MSPLVDPRTVYDNNYPFPDQDFPGLQSNWNPPIDSGEHTYKGSCRLQGRRALITGGDSGVGRAVAIAFAREGADVAISYLPEEEPDAKVVQQLIEEAGQRAVLIPGDIQEESYCEELVTQAAKELGGLDILVNGAAYIKVQEPFIGNTTTEIFDRTFKTNVYGAYWITRAASRILPPGSCIIFTTSTLASRGLPGLVDLCGTKAVYVNWTRLLARELGPRGIRVNAVAPSFLYTNFPSYAGFSPETIRQSVEGNPTGRGGQAVECAHVYVTLAESRSSFISGSIYGITGGTGEF